ncbi:isoleucine-tRNA ligase [Parahypoxylon ruwenzoriense]
MSKSWSSTLRLPKSTFPPRPLPQFRKQYIQQCADDLYEWQKRNRPSNDTFVIHDGPPYANGDLHVGHALNKILKDMILRVKIQQGRGVEYIPGWDCHGLPIELRAIENFSEGIEPTPFEIRRAAQNLASKNVQKQMESFRSFGVMADWDRRWTTMDVAFEIRQLRLFQEMFKSGLITRALKPVYWSPSSRTALAEAELEYKDDHISHAAWVKFPLTEEWRTLPRFDHLSSKIQGPVYAVIWTTTPWTLPANRAIAVHDELQYCIIRWGTSNLLVSQSRIEILISKIGGSMDDIEVIATFKGEMLRSLKYVNRLQGKNAEPGRIIHADFVSEDSGSGLVHVAPGHGFDDFEVCQTHRIPPAVCIDDEGKFTADAFPDSPEILQSAPSVIEGGGKHVLGLLEPHGDVLRVERYQHKYPYDWRTKKPVVIRATQQWFADVGCIKEDAVAALDDVSFIPESGRKRLESFIQGRKEWCISRQRAWGVPIPALHETKTGASIVSLDVIESIISAIEQRGISAWWSDPPDDPSWLPHSLQKLMESGPYRRGTDTMDVWFDSGSSWMIMRGRADVYLEGSDQHRGWFQSSLLTRVAAGASKDTLDNFDKGAPFKKLITHGFTLDQNGKKMSKSLGNVIQPHQVMDGSLLPPMKQKKGNNNKDKGKNKDKVTEKPPVYDSLGPDALRLWVASSDYTRDVVIGASVLAAIHTALLKYRTIVKMLLGSAHESARTAPLSAADHIAIIHLQDTMKEVGGAFDNYEFYKGFAALNRWITNDLSAFYLEALKDRLYCGDGGGVLEPILTGFLRMLAPMTPLLVEEAWSHRPEWMIRDSSLVHPHHQLYDDPIINPGRFTRDLVSMRKDIPVLMSVHAAIKSGLEAARGDKMVGSSLQSSVILDISDAPTREVLEKYEDELEAIFVVSSVEINVPPPTSPEWSYTRDFSIHDVVKGKVMVLPPKQAKCPRCWRYVAPVEDALCKRCEDVVAAT